MPVTTCPPPPRSTVVERCARHQASVAQERLLLPATACPPPPRCTVVERRARHQTNVAQERLHLLEGYLLGLARIKEVVQVRKWGGRGRWAWLLQLLPPFWLLQLLSPFPPRPPPA